MGYILPITQYTYVNYQARMMDSKKSPHYIGKPYKVVFNKIQQNHPDTYAQNRHYHMDKDERTTPSSKGDVSFEERVKNYNKNQETDFLLKEKGRHLNIQV